MLHTSGNVHLLQELVPSSRRIMCVARWYRDSVQFDISVAPDSTAVFDTWTDAIQWARRRSEVVTAIAPSTDGGYIIYSAGQRQPSAGSDLPVLDEATLAVLEASNHRVPDGVTIADGPPVDTY